MTNELDNLVKTLNKFFKNKVLKYTGPLIYNVEIGGDIDFKVEVLGTKKMISVGEWYDFLTLKITIISLNNEISKLLFGLHPTLDIGTQKGVFMRESWFFKQNLIMFLQETIRFFEDIRLTIEDIEIDIPESKQIQEQKMTRLPIRTVVKDIINVLKKGNSGEFYLPENDYGTGYSFDKFPVEFSVELSIKRSNQIDGYKMNANYSNEDEVVEVLIIYNPKDLKKSLYDIVGELNEIISHELEHSLQSYRGELEHDDEDINNSLQYYTQPHEISAQIAGFKRLSKLRKLPFEKVVQDWFDTHKDVHELNDREQKIVMDTILKYKK